MNLDCEPGPFAPRAQAPPGRGGRRYLPYVFTEQGVAMLSSVLRGQRAVRVNIEIRRAFVRLRRLLATHRDLARKPEALEKKYDAQFKVVFEAIRQLMQPSPEKPKGADRVPARRRTERYAREATERDRWVRGRGMDRGRGSITA